MKVLLDHCVPRRFGRLLAGHQVRSAFEMGWSGLSNGVLLAQARPQFDAFLTVDQNVQFQQNLMTLPLPVARLHRARVPGRQGAALAEGLADRMRAAEKLPYLDKEAIRLGLKGDKKHEFLCTGVGWDPRTSPKRISRLRKEFKNWRPVEKRRKLTLEGVWVRKSRTA